MILFVLTYFLIPSVNCWNKYDPMCNNTNASCNYQFGRQVADNFCQMVYHPINNSTICERAFEENAIRHNRVDLGKVTFSPYYGDRRTVFELIFTDIKWKMMKVRFKERYNASNCMVKDFYTNGEVFANEQLSYDCPWHDARLEGHAVDFSYEYGREFYETRRKYTFIVPYHENLTTVDNKEIYFFTYVDYTNLDNLILLIEPAPVKFNVTQYEIEMHYTIYADTFITTTYLHATYNTTDPIKHNYRPYSSPGAYSFHVKPISVYCERNQSFCPQMHTPSVFIPSDFTPFIIGYSVLSLIIIISLIIFGFWLIIWLKRNRKQLRTNVLLLTVPSNNAHTTVATALSKFLESACNVNVIFDHNDIPKTSLNSFDWLKTILPTVTHIVFLRSNDRLSSSRVIYPNIYRETLLYLSEYGGKKCVLSFPYSSDVTCKELNHVYYSFKFNKDFLAFLNFISGFEFHFWIPKNKHYYDLLNAVKTIENELQDQKIIKNNFNIVINEDLFNDEDHFPNHIEDKDLISLSDTNFNNLLGLDDKQIDDNISQCSDESDFDINQFNVCGSK